MVQKKEEIAYRDLEKELTTCGGKTRKVDVKSESRSLRWDIRQLSLLTCYVIGVVKSGRGVKYICNYFILLDTYYAPLSDCLQLIL